MAGKRIIQALLIAGLLGFHPLVGTTNAQEKKEPPPRPAAIDEKDESASSREAKLPKIDLPEFVITGREFIELPLTSKLDQSGAPGYLLDASRLTVLGEKNKDSLSGESEKPGASLSRNVDNFDGRLSLGYGRFNSAYGEGWFGRKYEEGDFNLHGRYRAHKGYVDHADATAGSLDASGGLYLPRKFALFRGSRLTGQVSYEGEDFRFFGSAIPDLKRTVNNFQVGIGLLSGLNSFISHESSVSFQRLTLRDRDRSREDNLSFAFRASKEAAGFQFRGEFFYVADFLDQSNPGNDPHYLRTTAGFRKLLFDKFDLSAGLSFYFFRNSDTGFKSKFYPNVALQYYLNRQLTAFAQFEPRVERNSLSYSVSENRYIGNDISINHQDVFVNFSGGVQFDILNRGTGRVYLKYQRINNFPLYDDPTWNTYVDWVPLPFIEWDLFYGGTTRFVSINGEVVIDLTNADRLSGTLRVLSSHNSSTEEQAPYVAPVFFMARYSHHFPIGLSTQVVAQLVGERRIGIRVWSTTRLNSYFLLDASAEYSVRKNITIFLRLNNIFDEHYSIWNRYRELPFSILGGVSVKW